jgi:hypothetical protein
MTIRAPKDFWAGVMFIAFAAVAVLAARGYSLGTAGRMGPGYFPVFLGSVLAFLGIVLVGRSFVITGEPVSRLVLRPVIVIALAVLLFGVSITHLGLVISLIAVVMVSAFASSESRPIETAILAAVLAVFSVGVFAYALRLPLPLWPQF